MVPQSIVFTYPDLLGAYGQTLISHCVFGLSQYVLVNEAEPSVCRVFECENRIHLSNFSKQVKEFTLQRFILTSDVIFSPLKPLFSCQYIEFKNRVTMFI